MAGAHEQTTDLKASVTNKNDDAATPSSIKGNAVFVVQKKLIKAKEMQIIDAKNQNSDNISFWLRVPMKGAHILSGLTMVSRFFYGINEWHAGGVT